MNNYRGVTFFKCKCKLFYGFPSVGLAYSNRLTVLYLDRDKVV